MCVYVLRFSRNFLYACNSGNIESWAVKFCEVDLGIMGEFLMYRARAEVVCRGLAKNRWFSALYRRVIFSMLCVGLI